MAFYYNWRPYVPVAERRAKARKEMEKLRKKGVEIQPVELEGRTIARSFWGKAWCMHLESFSDYENRLPRGRTYVRNGSVCHLEIKTGRIEAMVSGSSLYKITITIKPLAAAAWKAVKEKCRGQIGSMLELLQGRLSDNVMAVVSDRRSGLFPQPGEIKLDCSCPDWATMCKHVAAALYGIGSHLDSRPELLFVLRGVDASELIAAQVALPSGAVPAEGSLAQDGLSAIFGIDLEDAPPVPQPVKHAKKAASGKTATQAGKKTPARKFGENSNDKSGWLDGGKSKPVAKRAAKPAPRPKPAPIFNPDAPTGPAIARLRAQAGLSASQFAKALGVSEQSVQRWEAASGPLRIRARPLAALDKLQNKLASGRRRPA